MTKGIILKEKDNIQVVYCKHCKKTIIYKKEKLNKFINCNNCDYLLELKPLHSKKTIWIHSIIWGIIGLNVWINSYMEDPSILDEGSTITILTIIVFGCFMGSCTYAIQRFIIFCKYFKLKRSIKSIDDELNLVNSSLKPFKLIKIKTQFTLNTDEFLKLHSKISESFISCSSDLLNLNSHDNNMLSSQKNEKFKPIKKQDNVADENKFDDELNILKKVDDLNNTNFLESDNVDSKPFFDKIENIVNNISEEKSSSTQTTHQKTNTISTEKKSVTDRAKNHVVNKILQNLYTYMYDHDKSRKMIQNFLRMFFSQNTIYSMISVISLQYEMKQLLWIKDNAIDNHPIIKDSLEYVSDKTTSYYASFYEIFMEEFGQELQSIVFQSSIRASDFHFKDEEKFNSNLIEYPILELLLTESVEIMANEFKQRFPLVVASNKGMLETLVKKYFFDNSSILDDETLDLYFCYVMKVKADEHRYDNQIIIDEYSKFLKNRYYKIDSIKKELEKEKLKSDLLSDNLIQNPYTIEDIDEMSGQEFEIFLFSLFEQMGYTCNLTSQSYDQGLDLIAEKCGKKIGIQAKCYKNQVGNKAVQEIVSGMQYYNCDEGMVVTNSQFTSSADDLASKTGVFLWNRAKLMEIMSQYPVNKKTNRRINLG